MARGRVNSATGVSCTSGLTCVQGTNVTNLAVLLVNNPGTPNGGLYARFAPILNLFGINPVTPGGVSASSTGIALNGATVGLALGYNALSDFPATLNPFAIANSLLATLLPTYLLGGGQIEGASLDDIYTKLGLLAALGISSSSYSTFVPNDLPLLEPLRLPVRIINAVLNAVGVPITLGTPLADALQPALTILVNTGYTDVQTAERRWHLQPNVRSVRRLHPVPVAGHPDSRRSGCRYRATSSRRSSADSPTRSSRSSV